MGTKTSNIGTVCLFHLFCAAALLHLLLNTNAHAADSASCYLETPVLDQSFTVTNSMGALTPMALARDANSPEILTKLFSSVSWTASGLNSLLTFQLDYKAELSFEYPIYRFTLDYYEADDLILSDTLDYTDQCQDPRGLELFAGAHYLVLRKIYPTGGANNPHFRLRIWGGRY